jgi:O-antigen/teichoic acid export membrane protein
MSHFTKTKIFNDLFIQYFDKFLRLGLGFILIKKLSNFLGVESYGSLVFIESNFVLIAGISMFGMEPIIIKLFSKYKKEEIAKYLQNSLLIVFLSSILCLLVFNLWIEYFLSFKYKNLLRIISFIILFNPLYFVEYYLNSTFKISYFLLIRLTSYIISFLIKFYLIEYDYSLKYFVFVIAFENALILLTYLFILKSKKIFQFKVSYSKEIFLDMLKQSSYIFFYGLGVNLFSRIDILMIENYLNLSDLGNYVASFKLFGFISSFMGVFGITFYPYLLKSKNSFSQQLRTIYFLSFWSGIALCISCLLFSNIIINLIYSSEYILALPIFQLLIIGVSTSGISSVYVKQLYNLGLQKQLFYKTMFLILFSIIVNYFFIFKFGVIGVTVSTLLVLFVSEFIYDFFDSNLRDHHLVKLKAILYFSSIKHLLNR